MVLKVCPLPADIVMLGADGVNKIWRDAKLRAAGMKRARPLVEAAKHSVGSTESPEAAKYEMELLLGDYDVYKKRLEELTEKIEVKLEEIPYVDKLLEIKGVGKKIVSGLIAEIGDISRFDNPKQVQKLAGYAIVACSSGKHKGESHISYRGRKRIRYTHLVHMHGFYILIIYLLNTNQIHQRISLGNYYVRGIIFQHLAKVMTK